MNSFIIVRNGAKFIFINDQYERFVPQAYFYPFTNSINYYDYTELFVYVGGAWLGYFLYRLWSK